MPNYRYRALNSSKKSQQGRIWALNAKHATRLLEEQGMQKVFLKAPAPWEAWLEKFQPQNAMEQTLCCRQLAIMLHSGLPLVTCLEVLLRQPLHVGLYRAYDALSQSVQSGNSMSDSMRKSPNYFDPLYIGLVRVGERTGNLAQNVEEVALHLERDQALVAKVKGAMTYPLIVSVLSMSLAYFMVQHILPRFINGLFADSGINLPWYTQLLISVTNFFQNPLSMGLALALLTAFLWLVWRYFRTDAGQIQFYEWAMKWGPTRKFFGKVLAVRTARMLATAVDAGLPAIQALDLVSESCANPYLSHYLAIATEDLRDGNPLSACFRAVPFLPPTFCGFVELGEEASGLPRVLLKAAEMMELEIDEVIESFTQMLEPLLVGALGGMVGFVLISLFVPMYQVIGNI